jgi:hypothetical protein
VPDRRLVEEVAAALGTRPGLVEKDWHVVRAIGVIAGVDTTGMMPAFSGGTSLSKAWGLIKRFSEDIDFKVGEPAGTSASRARRERSAYRERILEQHVASAPRFSELVLAAAAGDVERGVGSAGDAAADFAEMLRRLETDPLWAREYEGFVRQVSFAGPGEGIDFATAFAACARLVKHSLPE